MLANVLQPLIDLEEWVLESLHGVGLGWGLAIVGLTLLVRTATLPVTIRQFRAQREMRRHMPELKRIRERHRHDPERLREKTLAYYAEHGINPLAALAPVLLQIPIFISLYYLLRTDVASGLFGDAGFLFIPDLTERPHGAVLAVLLVTYTCSQLAGAFVSTRALAGGHRKLALALPVVFAGVAARFPAGLLVYWITTSLWTLGQHVTFWRLAAATAEPIPAPEPVARSRPHPVSKKRRRKRKRRR
jgi:YidC/Oxa1 family membrane protein insertase